MSAKRMQVSDFDVRVHIDRKSKPASVTAYVSRKDGAGRKMVGNFDKTAAVTADDEKIVREVTRAVEKEIRELLRDTPPKRDVKPDTHKWWRAGRRALAIG